ncbi:MAG: hypothetical protein IK135_01070 [Bacteroidales bacterium]|nr:hypothetical protein [Bacteroidales bacterium]
MKKALAIALCCITILFSACQKENNNKRFIGNYKGTVWASGTYDAIIPNIGPMHQEFTDQALPVELQLNEGENSKEVSGICKIEDQEIPCKGTVDGNIVTFSAVDEVFTIDYQGFSPEIKMTYNIKGTLSDGTLTLDGNCSGNGSILFSTATLNMNATMTGSLTQIR